VDRDKDETRAIPTSVLRYHCPLQTQILGPKWVRTEVARTEVCCYQSAFHCLPLLSLFGYKNVLCPEKSAPTTFINNKEWVVTEVGIIIIIINK